MPKKIHNNFNFHLIFLLSPGKISRGVSRGAEAVSFGGTVGIGYAVAFARPQRILRE